MNNLKRGVVVCGVVGLVACFIPEHGRSFWAAHTQPTASGGGAHIYMVLGAYALALVVGALATAKSPLLRWQSLVALISFAFVLFKLRRVLGDMIGDTIKDGHVSGPLTVMAVAAMLGGVFSLLTLVKPAK